MVTVADDRSDTALAASPSFMSAESIQGGSTLSVMGKKLSSIQLKRQQSRLKKWMGDISLQVCSPGDAMESYLSSIADLRSYSDNLWLAGALKGLAMSIFLVLRLALPVDEFLGDKIKSIASQTNATIEIAAYRLAEERFEEAIATLNKTSGAEAPIASELTARYCFCLAAIYKSTSQGTLFSSFLSCSGAVGRVEGVSDSSINTENSGNALEQDDNGDEDEDRPLTPSEKNRRFLFGRTSVEDRVTRAADLISMSIKTVSRQSVPLTSRLSVIVEAASLLKAFNLNRKCALTLYTAAVACAEAGMLSH